MNDLVLLIAKLVNKQVTVNNIPGPIGVMGRNSHNKLIKETINWAPQEALEQGLLNTITWITSKIGESDE